MKSVSALGLSVLCICVSMVCAGCANIYNLPYAWRLHRLAILEGDRRRRMYCRLLGKWLQGKFAA